jgi:hypothetical protein
MSVIKKGADLVPGDVVIQRDYASGLRFGTEKYTIHPQLIIATNLDDVLKFDNNEITIKCHVVLIAGNTISVIDDSYFLNDQFTTL